MQVSKLDIRGAAGLQEKLQLHWPQARLAQQLTRLETNVPGLAGVPDCQPDGDNLAALVDYLSSLGLTGPLLRRCQKLAEAMAA